MDSIAKLKKFCESSIPESCISALENKMTLRLQTSNLNEYQQTLKNIESHAIHLNLKTIKHPSNTNFSSQLPCDYIVFYKDDSHLT